MPTVVPNISNDLLKTNENLSALLDDTFFGSRSG